MDKLYLGFSEFFLSNPVLTLFLFGIVFSEYYVPKSKVMGDTKFGLSLNRLIQLLIFVVAFIFIPEKKIYVLIIILLSLGVWYTLDSDYVQILGNKYITGISNIILIILIITIYSFNIDSKEVFINSNMSNILRLLLFFSIIGKPVNEIFKTFFRRFQVAQNDETLVQGAGAAVGILERLIMGIFVLMGQFAAIGLIFTAKSVARYNKISENQSFAEYYLIGSLFSMISVLVTYILLYL